MGVLLERKTQVIFVTASSVEQNGKAREVIVESRPQYAVVQLNGSKEKYPIAWEMIYELAKEWHTENLRLEAQAQRQAGRIRPKKNLKWQGLRYSVFGDFFAARFAGFAEELVAGTTSAALFLAHRAPTILRAWALRSSGVSFAHRALPPSDWIIFRCSRTVRSFLSFLSIFLYRRLGVSQIYPNRSFNIEE
jgi:hypothetical protein